MTNKITNRQRVYRTADGNWCTENGKGIYTGEDAKILDKLFGVEDGEDE